MAASVTERSTNFREYKNGHATVSAERIDNEVVVGGYKSPDVPLTPSKARSFAEFIIDMANRIDRDTKMGKAEA